jgi:hypothetical protein
MEVCDSQFGPPLHELSSEGLVDEKSLITTIIGLRLSARHDKMSTHMRKNIMWPLFLVLSLACNRTGADSKGPFTADAVMDGGFPDSPRLTGKA